MPTSRLQAIVPLPLALPKPNIQQPNLPGRPDGQLRGAQRRHQIRQPCHQHHILPAGPERRLSLAATKTHQLPLRRAHHLWLLPSNRRHGIRSRPTATDLQHGALLR